jgi:hypothetical protein
MVELEELLLPFTSVFKSSDRPFWQLARIKRLSKAIRLKSFFMGCSFLVLIYFFSKVHITKLITFFWLLGCKKLTLGSKPLRVVEKACGLFS